MRPGFSVEGSCGTRRTLHLSSSVSIQITCPFFLVAVLLPVFRFGSCAGSLWWPTATFQPSSPGSVRAGRETTILPLFHFSIFPDAALTSFTFAALPCTAGKFSAFSHLAFMSAALSFCLFFCVAAVWTACKPFSSFQLGVGYEWEQGWLLTCSQLAVQIRHALKNRAWQNWPFTRMKTEDIRASWMLPFLQGVS